MPGFFDMVYRSGPPRSELGFATGPVPGTGSGIVLPFRLAPGAQIYSLPESLGRVEQIGAAGNQSTGVGVGDSPTPREAANTGTGGATVRGPHGININLGVLQGPLIAIAGRALGLPGIVISVLNAIISGSRRGADPTTTLDANGVGQFVDISPATGGISRGDYPSLADVLRSAGGDDAGDPNPNFDVVLPDATPSPVGEDQSLQAPADNELLAGDYGSTGGPALSIPGPETPF